jgi:hypothetical protein
MLDLDGRIALPGVVDIAIYPDDQRPRAFYAIPAPRRPGTKPGRAS